MGAGEADATSKVFNLPPGGDYEFLARSVTGTGEVSGWSSILVVSVPIRAGHLLEQIDTRVAPNPAHEQAILFLPDEDVWDVALIDLHGRLVRSIGEASVASTIDVADLSPGVYVVRSSNGSRVLTDRLVVR